MFPGTIGAAGFLFPTDIAGARDAEEMGNIVTSIYLIGRRAPAAFYLVSGSKRDPPRTEGRTSKPFTK
jgi:hypothetical protein